MELRNTRKRNTRKLIVNEINKKMDEKNDKMIETLIMELDMLRKQVENLQREREMILMQIDKKMDEKNDKMIETLSDELRKILTKESE